MHSLGFSFMPPQTALEVQAVERYRTAGESGEYESRWFAPLRVSINVAERDIAVAEQLFHHHLSLGLDQKVNTTH